MRRTSVVRAAVSLPLAIAFLTLASSASTAPSGASSDLDRNGRLRTVTDSDPGIVEVVAPGVERTVPVDRGDRSSRFRAPSHPAPTGTHVDDRRTVTTRGPGFATSILSGGASSGGTALAPVEQAIDAVIEKLG